MNLLQRFINSLSFLLLLTVGLICQADNNSVVLAVEDSWPPYANSKGEGLSTSILKQALSAVDIKLIIKVYPYARVLDEVAKGVLVGGYNVTRQASTEQQFLFGEQPLLTAQASFYFSKDHPEALSYKSVADIPDGTTIGLIIDYEYGNEFEKHKHRFNEVRVSQQEQIINMLNMGRLDSAILFDAVASYTLKAMNLETDSLLRGPLNHTSDIFVAFSRSHKQSEYFSKKLDLGLIKIKNNGLYQELLQY
jgi:polar amino acid transport system substrate-binding protein